MDNKQLTPVQQEIASFFSPVEINTLKRQFKSIFKSAAFESDIAQNSEGKDALCSFYQLIEILDNNG